MTTVAAIWHDGSRVSFDGRQVPDPRGVEGWDVHVLRDTTSLPLRSILALIEDDGNITRADATVLPADVQGFAFIADFAGQPGQGPAPGGTANGARGGGVFFNLATGEVTAETSPPTPRLRSFVVRPMIIRGGGAGPLTGPPIRVLVHETVSEIRLTPSHLSIAGDADRQRLTVLARFDDDTIGDITHLGGPPAGAGQLPAPGFTWTSSDNVCVQPDGDGRLTGVFGLFACTATITATLRQPGWPALSATAQVTTIDEWGNQPPSRRELHHLGGPGVTAVNDVPNVLLLPDGFLDTPQDRADFDALASLVVQRLHRNPSSTPFDVLEHVINYWSAFVPSRERGTSTLDDLLEDYTLLEGAAPGQIPVTALNVDTQRPLGSQSIDFVRPALTGQIPNGVHFTISGDPTVYTTTSRVAAQGNALRGVKFTPALAVAASAGTAVTVLGRRVSVPRGVPAPPGNAAWTIDNLAFVVGLPIPAERLPHRATPAEFQAKLAEWTTLYGPRIQQNRIDRGLYDQWNLLLADHRLADEKDTAFGLATGERPRAQVTAGEQTITFHPLRVQRAEIDRYLTTLSFRGTLVGPTWTLRPDGTPAKDRRLVFVLARGARLGGSNRGGPEPIVALGLVDDENVRATYGLGRSMQTISHPLVRDLAGAPAVTNYVHATIAHEAAHSFGVTDEYGGEAVMPPGAEAGTFDTGNVTPRTEVAAGAGITGATLRWRWPRITGAGVLAGPPVPDATLANLFHLTLVPRSVGNLRGDLFAVGDTVFLRQRPLLRPPTGTPPALTLAAESPPLRVAAVPSDTQLDVSVIGGGVLRLIDFNDTGLNAPIVFRPAAATATAAAAGDRYAELMTQMIRRHITGTAAPLNAPVRLPPAPPPPCVPLPSPLHMEPQQATNLPPAADFLGGAIPAIPSRLIGAYDGGATFSCGVYHPAGACIMRAPLATRTEQAVTTLLPGSVHGFCHVCRYLIVDAIDPRVHFMIDFFYHDYPQP